MTKPAAQYLREQAVVSAAINLLLNGALAWLLYRRLAVVPLGGEQGLVADLLITAFLVPLLVSLIATPLVRRDVARARVERQPLAAPNPRLLRRLPSNALALGLLLGLIAAIVIGGLTIGLLRVLGVDGLTFGASAMFKAGFAGLLAFWAARWVVARALTAAPASTGS
ncbi:MAG: hypothetical protein ACREOF_13575 [Gemmatimonadales bacterium]